MFRMRRGTKSTFAVKGSNFGLSRFFRLQKTVVPFRRWSSFRYVVEIMSADYSTSFA